MSIINRIADLERIVFGPDDDGPAQAEFCSWEPHESPPDVPPGIVLTGATERLRDQLLAMDDSVPHCNG